MYNLSKYKVAHKDVADTFGLIVAPLLAPLTPCEPH